MKLERLHEYITVTVVTALGVGGALYCGSLVGAGRYNTLAIIAIAVALILFAFKMRQNVWMIIPILWPLSGKLVVLPVPFAVNELAVLFVLGVFLLLRAVKVLKFKPSFGWIDFIFFFNLLYLASVFIRNPVGVSAFDSDRVGGKPYFEALNGFLAYWCLSRAIASPKQARRIPLYTMIPISIVAALGLVAMLVPSTTFIFNEIYSGITGVVTLPGVDIAPTDGSERFSCFQDFGQYGIVALCSYFLPTTLFIPIYFFRFCSFLLLAIAQLLSGFRSIVMYSAGMFFLGSYFRKGWRTAITLIAVGLIVLLPVVVGQGNLFKLPVQMQRALCFLPGKWDDEATSSAMGSTDWRVEMWKQVLSSDKYILNKWLGDGFGMTRRQLESISVTMYGGPMSDDETRENAMIAGDYHSGPISTLHVVGAVGVMLTYLLMISMAIMAWKLIIKARPTPYFVLALFIGMQAIFEPFFFTFVFGAFNHYLSFAGFSLGMLKLIDHSLSLHLDQQKPAAIKPDFVQKTGFQELEDRRAVLGKS